MVGWKSTERGRRGRRRKRGGGSKGEDEPVLMSANMGRVTALADDPSLRPHGTISV